MDDSSDDDDNREGGDLSSLDALLRDAESIMGSSLPSDSDDAASVISATALLNTLSHSERLSPSIMNSIHSSSHHSWTSPSKFLDSVLPTGAGDVLLAPNLGATGISVDFETLMAQSSSDILDQIMAPAAQSVLTDSDDGGSFVTAQEEAGDSASKSTMGEIFAADISNIEDGENSTLASKETNEDALEYSDAFDEPETPRAEDDTFRLLQTARSMEEAPKISLDHTLEETPKRSGKGELGEPVNHDMKMHPPSFEILSKGLGAPPIFADEKSKATSGLELPSVDEIPAGDIFLDFSSDGENTKGSYSTSKWESLGGEEMDTKVPEGDDPPGGIQAGSETAFEHTGGYKIPEGDEQPRDDSDEPKTSGSDMQGPAEACESAEASDSRTGTEQSVPSLSDVSDQKAEEPTPTNYQKDELPTVSKQKSSVGATMKAVLQKDVSDLSTPNDGSPAQKSEETPSDSNQDLLNQQEGLVISPLSAARPSSDDIFRTRTKPASLQVEFPTYMDSAAKKSDAVSLSSASSTISFSSSARGLLGASTSPVANTNQLQGISAGDRKPRPPRIPKKLGADDPKALSDSLGKLVIEDDENATESRWMKQSLPTSFNFQKSIFAGQRSIKTDNEISPPGSPPEPVYEWSDDDDDNSSDASQELGSEASSQYDPDYDAWDMYMEPETINSTEALNHSGALDVTSGGDIGTEWSVASTNTGNAGSTHRPHSDSFILLKSHKSDLTHTSTVRKRRGLARALSFTSRDSSRRSLSSKGSMVLAARNSLPATMNAHADLKMNRRRPSLSPPRNNIGEQSPKLPSNRSSPDLRRLVVEGRRTNRKVSPLKIRRFLSDSDRLPIEEACSAIPMTPQSLALAARFTASQDTEDRSCHDDRGGVQLEEELVAFSSLEPFDLPFRYSTPLKSLGYLGSVRWRQLVARWKHSEMFRSLTARDPSPHFDGFGCTDALSNTDWSDSVNRHRFCVAENLILNDVSLTASRVDPNTKNFGGFCPLQRESSLTAVTRFLAELGTHSSPGGIRHELTTEHIDTEKIAKAAVLELGAFRSIIGKMVAFSERNVSRDSVRVLLGIKDLESIARKAKVKYGGDILRVKDVLRARIVFPDEGSLVCGLIGLFQLVQGTGQAEEFQDSPKSLIRVCRIKNLFEITENTTGSSPSALPTGYRHILINVRLPSGLLGEIQCNLRPLFDILGDQGYRLHKEIYEMQLICSGSLFDEVICYADACLLVSHDSDLFKELRSVPASSSKLFGRDRVDGKETGNNRQSDDMDQAAPSSKDRNAINLRQRETKYDDTKQRATGIETKVDSVRAEAAPSEDPTHSIQILPEDPENQDSSERPDDAQVEVASDAGPAEITPRQNNSGHNDLASDNDSWQRVLDQAAEVKGVVAKDVPKQEADHDQYQETKGVHTDVDQRRSMPFEGDASALSLDEEAIADEKLSKRDDANLPGSVPHDRAMPSIEDRHDCLEVLKSEIHKLQSGDVFLSILDQGARSALEMPRDVGTFYCLHILFSFLSNLKTESNIKKLGFGVETIENVMEYGRRCLLRCLVISNQAISIGMTGWLEYGRSKPFDRLTDRPFILLRRLAYDFGRNKQWDNAECVLATLVMHCEQHLPLYHPTTLTSMLDLAIVSTQTNRIAFGERLVSRVAERLSRYLLEMENDVLEHIARCRPVGKPGDTVFRIEHGRNAIFMLDAFVSLFERHLGREISALIGTNHEILLINHCLFADSSAVLANCVAAAKSVMGGSYETERSLRHWKKAFTHYETAFQGYAATKGLANPGTARAAYGLARCLRELGETSKALEILSLVVSSSATQISRQEEEKAVEPPATDSVQFLPRSFYRGVGRIGSATAAVDSTSLALCLWLMATLSLDESPEEGRDRAFSCLHAASVSLQSVLADESNDESTKASCIQFLAMIEEEAMHIAEPIYE